MREIKFRFWSGKEMFNGEELVEGINFNPLLISPSNGNLLNPKDYTQSFSKGVLMQFTGLKDKNGKEIFEGDIVKYNDALFIVEWDDDSGCFYLNKITQDNIIHDIRMNRLDMRAVIKGNKFENPELLEVQSR